jgi:pyruvate dehydrogenase E1 component
LSIRNDVDPEETREWLEALDDVLRSDGAERAEALIGELLDRARMRGVPLEVGLNTPYVNTIRVENEEQCPGDLELEHRIRAIIRWNAIAMVLNANKESSELGGHLASYQSAATLYEVGFNHFWRASSGDNPGDLVYMQGHSSPGIYARM